MDELVRGLFLSFQALLSYSEAWNVVFKAITGTAKPSSKLRRRSKTLHEFFSVKEEAIPQSAQRCWGGVNEFFEVAVSHFFLVFSLMK